MQPLVSILIPAHNARRWLGATIESALAQTWPCTEVIVVENGSTDGTLEAARSYAGRGVRVVRQEQAGGCAARNRAFALSKGDYIQWLDADDLLAPDKIERQMEVALASGSPRVLLSSAFGSFYRRPRAAVFRPTALWEDLDPVEWLCRKLGGNLWLQTATWLASRELTEAAGPWDEQLRKDQDGEYACRLVRACERVRFVGAARVYYRITGASSVGYLGNSRAKQDSLFRSVTLCIGHLRSLEDSARTRAAALRLLQGLFHIYDPERGEIVRRLQEMAGELGGTLERTGMGWKYGWMDRLFGRPAAKRAQRNYNRAKTALRIAADGLRWRIERLGSAGKGTGDEARKA